VQRVGYIHNVQGSPKISTNITIEAVKAKIPFSPPFDNPKSERLKFREVHTFPKRKWLGQIELSRTTPLPLIRRLANIHVSHSLIRLAPPELTW
jgi:hypothetical protein